MPADVEVGFFFSIDGSFCHHRCVGLQPATQSEVEYLREALRTAQELTKEHESLGARGSPTATCLFGHSYSWFGHS